MRMDKQVNIKSEYSVIGSMLLIKTKYHESINTQTMHQTWTRREELGKASQRSWWMMTVYWKSLSEVRDTDGVWTKRRVEMKT